MLRKVISSVTNNKTKNIRSQ